MVVKNTGEIFKTTLDILNGVNNTVWGGVGEAKKVGEIVKTGISGADVVIGTSHTLEDLSCNDFVCASLDIVGSVSSAVGMILGNIPSTKAKSYTKITGSITVGCRAIRYYCKNYGTYWGCTVAAGQGIVKSFKIISKK